MIIGGASSELNNLLNADDIPCYYKPSIKAVMDTITLEQEPFINKPCVSSGVCEHDKNEVLDKIRAEIMKLEYLNIEDGSDGYDKYIEQYRVLQIIDKYKAESEN